MLWVRVFRCADIFCCSLLMEDSRLVFWPGHCDPQGDLRRMWSEPFHAKTSSSRFLEVWCSQGGWRTNVGKTADLCPSVKGRGGGGRREGAHSQWGHVVTTSSCFSPICENPQKDTNVWITTAPHPTHQHDSFMVLTSCLFHLHFLFAVYFLYITAHPACAAFVLPPSSFPPPIFCNLSHLPLPRLICLASIFRFLYFPESFCVFLMKWRTRPPHTLLLFLWTYGCETWLGFVCIFLALSWLL